MVLRPAPLFTENHPGPDGGRAWWIETDDGTRLRVAHWVPADARGTVLLFPGRTEYVEKYGISAQALADRGLATITIDWRGQGLSDRLHEDRGIGHVGKFTDYQVDVAAMVRAARELDLPRPFYLLAHSMGACIALRSLIEGLDVQAAAFTGPMFGIRISLHLRGLARLLSHVMPRIGQGYRLPPGTKPEPYVLTEPFETNKLTSFPEYYEMMRDQLTAHPELSLGGPSFVWLREALLETDRLAGCRSPDLPCVTFLGSDETIVHVQRIHQRMESWRRGTLEIVKGARHEVLMEGPAMTGPIYETIAELYLTSQQK